MCGGVEKVRDAPGLQGEGPLELADEPQKVPMVLLCFTQGVGGWEKKKGSSRWVLAARGISSRCIKREKVSLKRRRRIQMW